MTRDELIDRYFEVVNEYEEKLKELGFYPLGKREIRQAMKELKKEMRWLEKELAKPIDRKALR